MRQFLLATTQFVFDRFGHLLEEASASGVAQKEYIWLDDLPVAMVDDSGSSPVLYFIHTDQLGTPQKITDGNANVVWEGLYNPFGNMITITGANWGTGVWGSFNWAPTTPPVTATNLRFPGQYADAETGLNQNWNRDYDPTIGRYVESDPIGLNGGVDAYVYSLNNPTNSTDPFGLCPDTSGRACLSYVARRDGLSLGADLTGAALLIAFPEAWGVGLAASGVALLASGYNFRGADVAGSIGGVVNAGVGYHLSAFSAAKSFSKYARFLGLGSDFLAGYLDLKTAMDDYVACRAGKAGP